MLPEPCDVADLTDNRATSRGVTAEVFTTMDYGLTQLWAAALHTAGLLGVRYWARHDLDHVYACLALFGPAGSPPLETTSATPRRVAVADDPELVQRLQATTGITVLPVPQGRT